MFVCLFNLLLSIQPYIRRYILTQTKYYWVKIPETRDEQREQKSKSAGTERERES